MKEIRDKRGVAYVLLAASKAGFNLLLNQQELMQI
jgi:hypothetical protein